MLVKVKYKEEFDILFLHNPGEKIKFSRRLGNAVIDFDFNGKAIGAEIINASKVLNLEKNILSSIDNARIRNILSPDSVMVAIMFSLKEPITYMVDLKEEVKEEFIA